MKPRFLVPAILGMFLALPVRAAEVVELFVEPAQIVLNHADDLQQLLVTGKMDDGSVRDVTRVVQYVSSNAEVAQVSPRGVVTAAKTGGQASVQISLNGKSLAVPVTLANASPRPVSFANDVMPILAKAGCNSGACHGAASGKRGFKISLRGYDPAADYPSLTRGTEGRRINWLEPGHSLLIQKPAGLVAHEGGKRFDADSRYARILGRWIGERAGSDLDQAVKLVAIEVSPAQRSFPQPNVEQLLLVTAKYSDGSRRDVTADARYSSSNESVAAVDEGGLVKLQSKGESAIMIRYEAMVAVSHFVALQHDPAFAWPNPAENNYVDRLVNAKLKHMEILPSEPTSDEQFLRRVFYDTIGVPPTADVVRAFLADPAADKRARIIDQLLARPEHAEFWALKWGDLLKIRFDLLKDQGTWGFYRWIRDSIEANKPFDQFTREIVTAEGSCAENPPANYWRVFDNPEEATEGTIQVFLGVRLLCAKCHDHPFEKWVQKDYYGISAFFAQVGRKNGSRKDDQIIFRNPVVAQARHPISKEALNPKFLDGTVAPVAAEQDARQVFAEWLTRKDNPFFAKATVNRLWSHLFGKGIIDPVDDIRSSNPAGNAELLDALAKDFAERNFDVRHLLRTILNSRTYQLSARTNPSNAGDTVNFSRYIPRRLSAEQLLDTLSQATGIRESFRPRYGNQTVSQPAGGLRAGQIPDRQLTAEMLDLFGRPRGESTCACERVEEASLTQALHLINGNSLATRLANPGGRLAEILRKPQITDDQVAEELYLTVLCRRPSDNELELVRKHFSQSGDRAKSAQDLMWALFNCREFLFNH